MYCLFCMLCCNKSYKKTQMSTHLPGFQSIPTFMHHFVMAKLATGSVVYYESFVFFVFMIPLYIYTDEHLNPSL